MKRVLTIIMTIAVMLTLAGCGNKVGQEADSKEVSQGAGEEAGQNTGQAASRETEEEASQSTGQAESRDNSPAQEDGSSGSASSSGEDADAKQSETSKETIELRNDYEDNFDVDEKAAAEFGRMIKEAVAKKDVEMLADLTGFPVYVGLSGGMVVETREDFIALDVEELLSDEMVSSMEAADENSLSPSMAGFTLHGGDGTPSITFGVREGSLAISGINYGH